MMYAYEYTLCRRGVVVTLDTSAINLHLFTTDPWLSDARNCLVLRLTAPVWRAQGSALQQPRPPQPTAEAQMSAWTVAELQSFLTASDLEGPATYLQTQGVNGSDFLSLTGETLEKELRCTPFAAKKILGVRQLFLGQA